MKNSRTSKAQFRAYKIISKHLQKIALNHNGVAIDNGDLVEVRYKNFTITLEIEVRIPNTRYAADMLMIIKNNVTGKTKQFAIEYDCLNWHRKWKDEKKNDMFIENNINVVRIQTFSQMPKPSTLWHFIVEIYNSDDEPKIMYYQLPDFIDDIWTGKLFLYYR